jgi:hypothetical protein
MAANRSSQLFRMHNRHHWQLDSIICGFALNR